MRVYRVMLVNRSPRAVEVPEDRLILDVAEEAGFWLPFGCRTGVCGTCAAHLIEGSVDQSKGVALKPAQKAMGYVLLCIASPRSDCKFEVGTECQGPLYVNPFKGG